MKCENISRWCVGAASTLPLSRIYIPHALPKDRSKETEIRCQESDGIHASAICSEDIIPFLLRGMPKAGGIPASETRLETMKIVQFPAVYYELLT